MAWHDIDAGARLACDDGVVSFEKLFAGVAVSDVQAVQSWYERFFGRRPDVIAHEQEVLWEAATGWVYVVQDDARAGRSLLALLVGDLDAEVAALTERGIAVGPAEPQGGGARKAVTIDPDGNNVALIEVRQPTG
jgi:predicted enzyme related to lactoylglutathione lyase